MPAQQCFRLALLWYADRLGLDWKPKDVQTMERMFADVGLSGDFWRVG